MRKIYLYMWYESNRFALFAYPIQNLPRSLRCLGNFSSALELSENVHFWSRRYPNKNINCRPGFVIKLREYTLDTAITDFGFYFPYAYQLKLDI